MINVNWIKIRTEMFNDEKIKLIETMPEADGILIIWIKILSLAGKINDGGLIYLSKTISYNDEMLSTLFNRKVSIIRLALETLSSFEMIEVFEGGKIAVLNWEKHQNIDGLEKIREQNKLRQQKHRKKLNERQKTQKKLTAAKVTDDVTLPVTLRNGTEKKREEKKREEDITAALVFLQDNYKKRKVNIDLVANRTTVKKCLKKFTLDEIKRGIMHTISEKLGVYIEGKSLERYLKVSTIFAVENMGKYVSDSEGAEVLTSDDLEKIVLYGEKALNCKLHGEYRDNVKSKVAELIQTGTETKKSFCELLRYAVDVSDTWSYWEHLLKNSSTLREIIDRRFKN